MDDRDGRSERLLARAPLDLVARPAHVLIGGLGVGTTLREALSHPRAARVTVVEVEPAVVRWNRELLGGAGALDDPRTVLVVGDLLEHLATTGATYDAVCLDVDNGPDWTVVPGNARLYEPQGLALVRRVLAPGGVLAVWGAARAPAYEALLARTGEVAVHEVPVARGEPDVVLVVRAGGGGPRGG
ncbi:spermidine synthase [Vallicoccus soli]|uniref:Spermidine synthase n=2 Tax=Vallicoccus soli TaxID=2339232 RepID=A0A3A3ZN83_9ACTN|nr:spermidine synthase [Vallicoccus soli]